MTFRKIAASIVVLGLVTAGCSKQEKDSEEVRSFIDATDTLARRFVYTEKTSDRTVVVQGLVEDDFRYKTKVIQDGADVLEAVVSDDSVAVRFLDPSRIDDWTDELVAPEVDQATDLTGIGVFDALRARRWVLDQGGAPAVVIGAEKLEKQGDDPLLDALTTLGYARDIAQAKDLTPMVKYNPEAISPTYRADEDPFPAPEEGSGVERYDLFQPKLPSAAQATSGAQAILPSALNFRKMAVYVKDGKVIQISEYIGLTPRLLRDLRSYTLQLIDTTAPENIRRDFRAEVERRQGDELGQFLLQGLNAVLEIAGEDPIRFRSMSLELRDLGAKDIRIDLPGETIKGSLAVLKNLGRKPVVEDAAPATGTGAGSGTATTSTSVAGG